MKLLLLLSAALLAFGSTPVTHNQAIQEVYLVPHSHCDAGWLVTYEAYYETEVVYILNSVVEQLSANPELRFIWAETIWLTMWWQDASVEQKMQMQALVNNGQLEFAGGGFVMNDETVGLYTDVIDQVTTGHEWLLNTFGPQARVRHGWQIDMFSGFSSVTPSLWALMGYDATVIRFEGTATVQANWTANKGYEFVWQASKSLPREQCEIFTHAIHTNYGSLLGFGFDYDQAANHTTNPPITDLNVGTQSAVLAGVLKNFSSYYRGPLMAIWGSDFRFQNASHMFGNMSLLVNYINANPQLFGMHIQYATLAEYFDALHSLDVVWPRYTDVDFEVGWPHDIRAYNNTIQYQTGALTSRPTFKGLIRDTNIHARPAELLYALAQLSVNETLWAAANGPALFANLDTARQARGLVQHHDSLAGTMASEQDNPTNPPAWCLEDYIAHLNQAIVESDQVVEVMLSLLATGAAVPSLSTDPATVALLSNDTMLAVVVHNPLGWTRTELVNVTLPSSVGTSVRVLDATGATLPAEVHPNIDSSNSLWFEVTVPPLGFDTYFVEPLSSYAPGAATVVPLRKVSGSNFTLSNAALSILFDGSSGRMASVASTDGRTAMRVQQEFGMYEQGIGGAYILYEPQPAVPVSQAATTTVSQGQLLQQAFNYYSDSLWQVVRLVNTSQSTDAIQNAVQVINHAQMPGDPNELVTTFSTDLATKGSWFIDESGLEMDERVFDPTMPGNTIGANYHAMVSSCYLRSALPSDQRQFTVLSRQSMGVISQVDGELEVMLHRRTNSTDSQGPWPLNDTSVLEAPLWLMVGQELDSEALRHRLNLQLEFPLVAAYGLTTSPAAWGALFHTSFQPFRADLPNNVHLLSLFARNPGSAEVVLRLQHLFEAGDHPIYSKDVTVDVASLFTQLKVVTAKERSLSLQQAAADMHRQKWHTNDQKNMAGEERPRKALQTDVTLGPIQMASFSMTLALAE